MSILENIRALLPDFSKNERRLADHVLNYPLDLQRYNAMNIAETCNVSRSAVIRFCQKLGFTGYADFQRAVLSELENAPPQTISGGSCALDIYRSCLMELQEKADMNTIAAVSDLIVHSKRVLCYGIDHSGYSARQMAFRLLRSRIDASFVGVSSEFTPFSNVFGPGDTVIVFSISGQKTLAEDLERFRSRRVGVILFTMNTNASIKSLADHVILLPSAAHSNSPHLLDDMICFLYGIELVIEGVHKKLKSA